MSAFPPELVAALTRWGFPIEGGEDAGIRALHAVRRVDGELDVLFDEQRERLNEIEARQSAASQIDRRDAAFMFAANADALSGGAA